MSFVRRLLGRKTENADEDDPVAKDAQQRPEQSDGQPQADRESDLAGSPTSSQQADAPAAEVAGAPDSDLVGFSDPTYPTNSSDLDTSTRSLAIERRTPGLSFGFASDVGQLRGHNEDTLIAFQGIQLGDAATGPFGFFIVTDGMGGHQAGEVASSLAARLVTHQVIKKVYLSFLLAETPGADMPPLTEVLKNAVEEANEKVHERVPGGGTTLTCALIMGRRAYIAHVGDSRAYLLIDRDMRQLTQDHSFVSRLIELGELSQEEAAVHPQRHVLYRAVGQGDALDIDTYQQPLPPGSRLLLCSDGLSGQVPEEEIGRIIATTAKPQQACERLVDAANRAGGPDNITAVIIEAPLD